MEQELVGCCRLVRGAQSPQRNHCRHTGHNVEKQANIVFSIPHRAAGEHVLCWALWAHL